MDNIDTFYELDKTFKCLLSVLLMAAVLLCFDDDDAVTLFLIFVFDGFAAGPGVDFILEHRESCDDGFLEHGCVCWEPVAGVVIVSPVAAAIFEGHVEWEVVGACAGVFLSGAVALVILVGTSCFAWSKAFHALDAELGS